MNRTITLILSDQFQRIWEKTVTGNGGKLCNVDFIISDRFFMWKNYGVWGGLDIQHAEGRWMRAGRKTLVGIVGFQAGMKHKTFRECCTQHRSIAPCQPYDHLRNRIPFVISLAGLFAHYAFTPLPVLLQMYASSFNPSPSCGDSPQFQLQGGLSITTLFGASRRFTWKIKVWLWSADLGVAT